MAVDPLIEALKDESYFFRMAAAMALGRIGDGRSVEPLITYLNDECYHCSGYAVDALVAIGEPAVAPLIEALKDESSCVRQAAVEALGTIGDERAIDPLIASLIDEDPDVRENAADALVAIGQHAIGPLTEALKDEDERVCNAATEVLQRIPVKKIRYEEAPSNIFEDKGIIGNVYALQGMSVGITAGDIDGDGDPDVFTVSGMTGIQYFENIETDQGREFIDKGNVSTLDSNGLEHYDIVLTDIDQDGALEIITVSRKTNIILHENISNGGDILFENRGEIDTVRVDYGDGISITAGDLNNDTKQDFFTASERDFAKVYVQQEDEETLSFFDYSIGEPKGRNVGIDTADLNNDGRLDAVTISEDSGILYLKQPEIKYGRFGIFTIQVPDDYPGTWRDLVLTDVDMDGDIDALITSTRDISYLENIGSVTEFEFVNRGVVGDPEANSYESANIIALDYDMDGDQDFIVATPDKLKLFENTIIDY